MANIKVSPAEGRRVRDPETMAVIAAGHEIDDANPYWFKRIRDRDVTIDDAGVDDAEQAERVETEAEAGTVTTRSRRPAPTTAPAGADDSSKTE